MNYALPPIGVVLIINYIAKNEYSKKEINYMNCIAIIVCGSASYLLKFGIVSINAIIITSLLWYIKSRSRVNRRKE